MLTAVTFVYRGAPLTDISLNWPTVGSMCQANNPSCPPTQYRIAPKATATIMARVAFSMASVVLVKWMGAVHGHTHSQREQNGHSGVNGHNLAKLGKRHNDAEEEGGCRNCCGDSAGHYGNAYMVDSLQGAPPLLTGMLQQKQNSLIYSATNRPSGSNQLKNPVI